MSDRLKKFDEHINKTLPKGFNMVSSVIEFADFSREARCRLYYAPVSKSPYILSEPELVLTFNPDAFIMKFTVLQKGIPEEVLKSLKQFILDTYKNALKNETSDENIIGAEIGRRLKNRMANQHRINTNETI